MKLKPAVSGFPEFNPKLERVHQNWLKIIRETFALHGFPLLDTPIGDHVDLITEKGADDKEVYVLKRLHEQNSEKKAKVALRFDHTVPLALYVSRNLNDLAFPFRRGVVGPVFRGERPQAGRFRQFTQADVDIISNNELTGWDDQAVIDTLYQTLKALDLPKFTFHINNRKLMQGFLQSLDILDPAPIFKIIDNKLKISAEEFKQEFQKTELSEENVKKLLDFLEIRITKAENLPEIENNLYNEGKEDLKAIITNEFEYWKFDPTIIRGLDYYTGTVVETFLDEYPQYGSIASGGRYDNLLSQYGKQKMPGFGMSIGLTRLLSVLDKENVLPDVESTTKFLVIDMINGISLHRFYENGINITKIETKKVEKGMKYAEKSNIPYVIVIGENEIDENLKLRAFKVKNRSKKDWSEESFDNLDQFFDKYRTKFPESLDQISFSLIK